MDTYLDERRGVCEVYAFDERGTRYCAVRVDARLPGWQHDLLRRLRDGDYRRADQFLEELYASEERKAKDKEHQRQELVGEMVDAVEGPLASAFGLGKRFH